MNAAFTPTPMRITTGRYQKMVAAGVLTRSDHVELIEGEILAMAPIGSRHAGITGRLAKRFMLAVGEHAIVRTANPVDLGDFSEPEPDVVLLRPRADDYFRGHPHAVDVLLLIEVAESSLAFDLGAKRDLYAKYGIAEYWVVDAAGERILVFQQPAQSGLRSSRECRRGDVPAPQAFPSIGIAVDDLFA